MHVRKCRASETRHTVNKLLFDLVTLYLGDPAMRKMTQKLVTFLKREDGPTAVEYAVMLALIIVVCIAAITALGSNANKTFGNVSNTIGGTGS